MTAPTAQELGAIALPSSTSHTAYTAKWVLPISEPPINDGVVFVEGSRIAAVGRAGDFRDLLATAHVVRLGNAVLMPGLVNAHTHLELTAMRGFLEGLDFRDWLRTLTQARRDCFDADSLLDSSRFGIVEALTHGITTCADTTESGQPLHAMHEMGVRGIGYIEVFGPDPSQAEESLAGLERTATAFRNHDTELVHTGVSPHAPYTVSPALFRNVAAFARSEQFPVAVHIAESHAETLFVRDGEGPFADRLRARGIHVAPQARSPIDLLDSAGLLDTRPLLIHAIHVDDRDLERIVDHGASIVHCPISNAKLGQGIAPLDRMLAHGVYTGLGTDSVASNDRMDMLGEARQATLFHALRAGTPDSLSAHDALALATIGSARALRLDDRVGTLTVGKDADLAAFPLDDAFATPVHDPAVALVHVLAGKVTATLVTVAGRILVRDGIVLQQDAGLATRISALGDRLRQWRTQHVP